MSLKQLGCRKLPAALFALTISTAASADGRDPTEGGIRDLATQWWQWAVSIPASVNPLLDTTGARCMVGQRGANWFLAGTFNGGTVSRTCSIPDNVTVFFPVVNSINFDTPDICGQEGSLSVTQLRKSSADFINSIDKVTVTLDSSPVRPIRHTQSAVFPVTLPEDNIFAFAFSCVVPSRVYPRAVDDGYYVKIENLSVGEHILQFTATGSGTSGTSFNLSTTYRLWVVARDRR